MLYQQIYLLFCFKVLISISSCNASPIRATGNVAENGFVLSSSTTLIILISITSVVCFALFGILCLCCSKSSLFKSWTRQRQFRRNVLQMRNGYPNGSEISVFPPSDFQHNSGSSSEIYFEPLPDITPRLCKQQISNDDWFAEPHKNFPRPQLQYVRKMGSGWFGQVLLGRAIGIDTDHTSTPMNSKIIPKFTPVVVKSLREDASPEEQALFLQELKPFRDLVHSNVLQILGSCLEKHPYLVMLEYCSKGDLKSVLRKESSLSENILIKMCQDVAAGLAYMHQHNFIHTDLAARNCLVEENFTVKIGDYGFSIDTGNYKDEYYLAENVALPIRWSPPETLRCTDTTIEAIPLNKEANVWSLGVVIWEILTRGDLPYGDLDEDSVIQQVILEGSRRLQTPTLSMHSKKLDSILHKCWQISSKRPTASYISALLTHLLDQSDFNDISLISNFEERWNQLSKSGHVQENMLHNSDDSEMKFETEFKPAMSSPNPSLKNLHGSAEDLDARVAAKFGSAIPSWLGLGPDQVMDSLTEEITDAIQRLDEALADEKSEPSSSIASPEKDLSANFKLGRDSLVNNPPGLPLHRSLSDREEDNLTMRLEMSDFSELVRLKSQSVQDFMRLTVVDDGSDSDKTSQPGSLVGDFNTQTLVPEKNFSSEGNLKEAVRDAGFLVELERYQAEHKFSIISEVSRDGMSSIEYFKHFSEMPETDSQSQPIDDTEKLSFLDNEKNEDSFLEINEILNDSKCDVILAEEPKEIQITKSEALHQKQASPDCVLSTRGHSICSSLPDIVSHDASRKFIYRSSNSSLEDETNESLTESEDKSKTDGSESPSDIFPPKEIEINSLYSEINFDDTNIIDDFQSFKKQSSLSDDEEGLIPLQSNSVSLEGSSDYSPQEVIEGEEVIFGALEDYSLGFYNSAKSSDLDNASKISVGQTIDIGEITLSVVETKGSNLFTPQNSTSYVNNVSDKITNLDEVDDIVESKVLFNKESPILNEPLKSLTSHDRFDSGNSSLNTSQDLQESDAKNECDKRDNENIAAELENDSSKAISLNNKLNEDQEKLIEKEQSAVKDIPTDKQKDAENDVFWERQMSAWQEAAAETRELLMQAAKKELELTLLQDSEDDLDINRSNSHTPLSDGGSPKSPFSSNDKLDTDDEGTYVSYATDDEILRYSPEEINALRSELCLMLEDSNEALLQENEESVNDLIYINYRGPRSMLSPIKEECCDSDILEVCSNPEYYDDDSSVEFTEDGQLEENFYKSHDNTFSKSPIRSESESSSPETPVPVLNGTYIIENPTFDMSSEDAKDSLILEDLESEGTPTSSQVCVGPIKQGENGEDMLVVDTETNKVTLVDSGRPQSTIAFLTEKEGPIPGNSQELNIFFDTEDDVAPESLPYESFRGQLSVSTSSDGIEPSEGCTINEDSGFVKSEMPHYHNYFTSGFSSLSLSYPTASIDGNKLVESVDHVSLPYDVNFQNPYENHSPETKMALDIPVPSESFDESKRRYSMDSDNEALILDDSKASEEPKKEFVTLSFLGRLYNNEQTENELNESADISTRKEDEIPSPQDGSLSSNYYSSKSEIDQPDNLSDSEIDEDLIPEDEKNEETPIRTPNHLVDFVWRADKEPAEPRYTPDWENASDSENNDEFESSSTSGEFIWQPGDSQNLTAMCQPSSEMTSLQNQNESEVDEREAEADDYEDESESGEEDFTPSIWNNQLTPQRSLIKVQMSNSNDKKSVHWKRQRHHRVYEYPPEPQSWHAEVPSNQNSRRTWKTHSLDYLTLADWEIGGDDFLGDDTDDFEEYYQPQHSSYSASQIYNFAPVSCDQQVDDFLGDKCEFYLGSPGSPFSFSRSSFAPSDFFQNKPNNSSSAINYDQMFSNEPSRENCNLENNDYNISPDLTEGDVLDNESDKPSNSESKLSREKLRLDLPTLCLAEEADKTLCVDNNESVINSTILT